MAFSTEEREALLELKAQGYSKEDALGFIAASRMGNSSKVERELTKVEEEPAEPSDALSDLKRGFEGGMQAVDEGQQRTDEAAQRPTAFGRLSGRFSAGLRFAGDALGSVLGGAVRAVPGGTTVMNKVEDTVSKGVQTVTESPLAKSAMEGYSKLPEGVKQPLQDAGNVVMGGLGLAEGLVAPGATKALTVGIKEFAQSGVKGVGREGIQSSINTGLAPEDLMQRVARISKGKQAAFEQRAGQSVGECLVDRGIFGDPEEITQQLYARMQESKGRVDAGLSRVQGTYKNDAVSDALEQLAEREARVSTDRTPSPDRNRVSELLNRHSKDGLTLSEVNEVKRLYERTVKLDCLRDNVSDKIAQANNIDSVIRDFVEKTADQAGFPNVKALNKETQLAKQLLDDLGAEYAGQAGNNYVSLSDAFFLAEAASNPTALAAFGLKKTLGSKSAMSSVAKLMARSREKRGLPTADLTERLGLPAPREGAPNVSVEQPINLPDRSQSTVDAQEQARVQSQLPEQTTGTPSIVKEQMNFGEDALESIKASMLDTSSAGISRTADGGYVRYTSFPNWIPSELRDSALFERVIKHIEDGTTPKANTVKEQELYGLVMEQRNRVAFEKYAEAEDWKNNSGGRMSIDDVPFSVLFATGGVAGAYYLMEDDSFIMPIAAAGLFAKMPASERRKLINRQLDSLSKAEKKLIEDGASYNSPQVRDIIKARKKLFKERDEL